MPIDRKIPNPQRTRLIISWVLFLTLFAVYAYTAAPNVTFHDSGELITAANALGIPHPPGSPVWCMVAHLFTRIPVGSIAYRVHLMSALFAALTCVLVYRVVLNLVRGPAREPLSWGHHTAGLMAALFLAQAPSFWEKAGQAELYAMNAFFVVAIFGLLERWLSRDPQAKGQDRRLILIALLFGLGMGNYQALIFFAPAVALAVAIRRSSIFRAYGLVVMLLLAGAAGLLAYAYLPIRSAANPVMDWGNPETWANFRQVTGRQHWGDLVWSEYSAEFMRRWLASLDLFVEMGVIAIVLAVAGVVCLARERPLMTAALLLGLVVQEGWMMLMQSMTQTLNNSLYYVTFYGMGEFHIPTYVVLSMFSGVGAGAVAASARASAYSPKWSRMQRRMAGGLAALICVGALLLPHIRRGNFRHYVQPHAYSARILDALATNSWLMAQGDDPHFAMAYLKFCENVRPDVALMKLTPAYFERLEALAMERGELTGSDARALFHDDVAGHLEPRYHQDISAEPSDAPVCFLHVPERPGIAGNLYPRGFVFELGARDEYSEEDQKAFWEDFLSNPVFSLNDESKRDYRETVAVALEEQARWHLGAGELYMARALFERCLDYSPAPRPSALGKLAYVHFRNGDAGMGIETCKRLLVLEPRNVWAWSAMGQAYASEDAREESLQCFRAVLQIEPDNEEAQRQVAASP